jgi:hypothetical protein
VFHAVSDVFHVVSDVFHVLGDVIHVVSDNGLCYQGLIPTPFALHCYAFYSTKPIGLQNLVFYVLPDLIFSIDTCIR